MCLNCHTLRLIPACEGHQSGPAITGIFLLYDSAMDTRALANHIEAQRPWMMNLLQSLVEQESPSDAPASINLANALVAKTAGSLGGTAKTHKQKRFGNILELRFSPARSRQKPLLLLGHLDTVWPLGTLKTMPFREANGRLWGPGVLDMKAKRRHSNT